MPSPLIECVPNFSAGRDHATIEALRTALTSVPGVRLLDVQADTSHNRSVFTFVAPPDASVEAALRAMRVATERIDLTKHTGEHPRMGATDVVPFVPVRDVTMEQCVSLARGLGERAAALLEIDTTPPAAVYGAVEAEAHARDVAVVQSEVVGLVPERAILGAGAAALRLADAADHLLEAKIRAAEGPTLDGWLEAVAGGAPVPGGGSAAALAGALAGALVAMVARLTVGRKTYAAVERRAAEILIEADTLRSELRRLVDDDAAAYAKVSAAYGIPKDDPSRGRAIDAGLVGAAQPPVEVARRAGRLVMLAREIAEIGNKNARSDARVAEALARAAVAGAIENVRVNVAGLSEPAHGSAMLEAIARLEREISPRS